MYNVICYKNTGFNAVNIPDSPELLEQMDSQTFPALDILQDKGLKSVSIKATYEQAKNIDYCKIGDSFYSVGTVVMTSADVAVLPLTYDALTTNGGASKIEYLDGLTERHTVADDTMFKYTQADEYTAPREVLQLVYGGMEFKETNSSRVLVESTIDLLALGNQFDDKGEFKGKGLGFTSTGDFTASGTEDKVTVVVPYTEGVPSETTYVIGDGSTIKSPSTKIYCLKDNVRTYDAIKRGLAAVRALGVESAIINQFTYPDNFVGMVLETGSDNVGTGAVDTLTGEDETKITDIKFDQYEEDNIKNNRVLYGEYNKYGLLTASGSKGEYLPEQIADPGDASPSIRVIIDPRPDGKPYFRFLKYCGDQSLGGFWIACLPGLQWQNVPLVYSKASGSYLNETQFDQSVNIKSSEYANTFRQGYSGLATKGGLFGVAQQAIADSAIHIGELAQGYLNWANPSNNFAGSPIDAIGTYNSYTDDWTGQQYMADQYQMGREKELQQYAIGQSAVAPSVAFPFNANVVRDFIGNGVFIYRYKYTDNDAKRVDKILTMYGYKDTVALTAGLFNNRENFDYVRASGVSVGGNITMWEKSIIAEQLNAGVRVWHVKPDVKYYTNNPIRGTK